MLGLAWVGLALLPAGPAAANNIRVANVGLTRQDTVAKTARVTFDLAWSNSWRSAENWDAAWVFVKFRAPGSSIWAHATLDTNSSAHLPGSNGAIAAAPDGKGVFVYRSANFTGDVNYAGVKLKWDYGTDGQDFAPGTGVDVSVHAVEMVYIPEGPFYLGSGGNESSHFYRYTDGSSSTNPFLVSSTNAITVTNTAGNLYYDFNAYAGDQSGVLSNSFPNGYAAFYCMKYEISQGQYTDFLNMLTTNQSGNRWPAYGDYRYTISRNAYYCYSANAPDRACNYLSWADGCAYADWSALRPLTELEYEKACRGPAYPVSNEYVWGNTTLVELTSELGTPGSGTVTPSPTNANCNYANWAVVSGPSRVGLFAARAAPTRELSGAGYYGAMDLGGNVAERCVSVGTNIGRAFTGLHGDGILTNSAGDADVIGWPGTDAVGSGIRGGQWDRTSANSYWSYPIVSARPGAAYVYVGRERGNGWRGVRTVP